MPPHLCCCCSVLLSWVIFFGALAATYDRLLFEYLCLFTGRFGSAVRCYFGKTNESIFAGSYFDWVFLLRCGGGGVYHTISGCVGDFRTSFGLPIPLSFPILFLDHSDLVPYNFLGHIPPSNVTSSAGLCEEGRCWCLVCMGRPHGGQRDGCSCGSCCHFL